MYVPSDSFGGLSPERKASQALEALLTFTAAKIVLAQLEGSGRGALAAYNQQQYAVLSSQLQEVSLRDPDAWLEGLLHKDKGIALRVMEVRSAYASTDFEWDQLQRLSIKALQDSNLALMRKTATASLAATPATHPPPPPPAAAAAAATAAAAESSATVTSSSGDDHQGGGRQPSVQPSSAGEPAQSSSSSSSQPQQECHPQQGGRAGAADPSSAAGAGGGAGVEDGSPATAAPGPAESPGDTAQQQQQQEEQDG